MPPSLLLLVAIYSAVCARVETFRALARDEAQRAPELAAADPQRRFPCSGFRVSSEMARTNHRRRTARSTARCCRSNARIALSTMKPSSAYLIAGAITSASYIVPYFASASVSPATDPGTPLANGPTTLLSREIARARRDTCRATRRSARPRDSRSPPSDRRPCGSTCIRRRRCCPPRERRPPSRTPSPQPRPPRSRPLRGFRRRLRSPAARRSPPSRVHRRRPHAPPCSGHASGKDGFRKSPV